MLVIISLFALADFTLIMDTLSSTGSSSLSMIPASAGFDPLA